MIEGFSGNRGGTRERVPSAGSVRDHGEVFTPDMIDAPNRMPKD